MYYYTNTISYSTNTTTSIGELVQIATALEPWAQKAFAGTKQLNAIQSQVFKTAYHSCENMLVSSVGAIV